MAFINLCLSIPNLDTIIFYIIFVITIPAYLFSTGDFETLKYYLPGLVMLSITLTEAGRPNLFKDLYPTNPTSMSGFLSVNLINGLALVGLLSQAIVIAMAKNNLTLGLVSGLITFTVTFPLAQQILPYFIREVDESLFKSKNVTTPGNWHKYMAGFFYSVLLLGLQYVLLIGFTQYILSSGTQYI